MTPAGEEGVVLPAHAAASWRQVPLGPRAHLYQVETGKFKTCTVRVYLHVPLAAGTATATALVPHLLGRGCRGWPDLSAVSRRLEELYGAGVGAGVSKLGEVQSLYLGLDVAETRYLPEDALAGAVDLLGRMCLEPALDGTGCFPAAVVAQEKENLGHRIRGLLNDKARYAALRCVQAMCGEEPYALSALGRLEDLPALAPAEVTARWRTLLASAAVDVFAVGGGAALEPLLAGALGGLPAGAARRPQTRPGPAPATPRQVIELDAVRQGKLCLGYRTGITRADPRHPAMAMYSAILGGFPHSKLFRNVREKASLAYYASAQWDALKGVLLIHSGIEPARFQEAVEIIGRQVADMAAGRIDRDELDFTKRGLANELRTAEDSPYGLIDTAAHEAAAGDLRPLPERMAQLEAVTREQVVEAAAEVTLDTVYFLTDAPPAGAAVGEARL